MTASDIIQRTLSPSTMVTILTAFSPLVVLHYAVTCIVAAHVFLVSNISNINKQRFTHNLFIKIRSVCPSVSAMVSESINPLPSDRLRCCDRYIRCQRSLAVKPLTMSGSLSHRGSVRRVSRSQVTHAPISNCSCSMCAMTVSKLMSTRGNYSCASGGDGRCASNGAFSTGVPVDWGLSQRLARVDCGLSYTTGQATIDRSAIVLLILVQKHISPTAMHVIPFVYLLHSCIIKYKPFQAI